MPASDPDHTDDGLSKPSQKELNRQLAEAIS